jgi:hypothetical protein
VRFELSKGDNKNRDTHVALTIAKEAFAIARLDDFAGDQEFGDPGNYGPFDLIVQPGVTKEQYRGSTTKLTIAPSGQDRVILNTVIDARFSDGEVLTTQSVVRCGSGQSHLGISEPIARRSCDDHKMQLTLLTRRSAGICGVVAVEDVARANAH